MYNTSENALELSNSLGFYIILGTYLTPQTIQKSSTGYKNMAVSNIRKRKKLSQSGISMVFQIFFVRV